MADKKRERFFSAAGRVRAAKRKISIEGMILKAACYVPKNHFFEDHDFLFSE